MTRIESQMTKLLGNARDALVALGPVAGASSSSNLEAAKSALDRFESLHAQIVALSRKNTNVRSLALSLGQKQGLISGCNESLSALSDALAKRGFAATR
jgi:hypothetical protein